MKTNQFLLTSAVAILGFAALCFLLSEQPWARVQQTPDVRVKVQEYRAAIKRAYQIDIEDFKESLPGGMADGKAITDYNLGQLLEGIKWEREHSTDSFIALEIAMDHLERIPDYYSHLVRMERETDAEKFMNM